MSKKIVIYKQAVYDDIDALTYKRVNTSMAQAGDGAKYDAASDSHDGYDRGLLTRMIHFKWAQLVRKLSAYLVSTSEKSESKDVMPVEGDGFAKFEFIFKRDYDDTTLDMMMEYIHRFLVDGTVYDWYKSMGLDSPISEQEVDGLLDSIKGSVMTSFVKMPFEPFGPRY